jgi:hypothetical protein
VHNKRSRRGPHLTRKVDRERVAVGGGLARALAGSLAATINAALLYGCAATPIGNTSAHDADGSLPAPDGLGVCAPDSPLKAMFASMASRAGELAGCFMSRQTVPVWGEPRAVNYPSEYAYAISYPSARRDLIHAKISKQTLDESKKNGKTIRPYGRKGSPNTRSELPIFWIPRRALPRSHCICRYSSQCSCQSTGLAMPAIRWFRFASAKCLWTTTRS